MLDPFAGRCQFGRQRFRVAVYNRRGNPAGPNDRSHTFARKVISMSPYETANGLTAAALEAKWRSNPDSDQRQNPFNLRMRRALSWLGRAEEELDDPDAAFIFYWIAFNALYSIDRPGSYRSRERSAIRDYFQKTVSIDDSHVIHRSIWDKFSGPIRVFLDNRYVFNPFWLSSDRESADAYWRRQFRYRSNAINRALGNRTTTVVLNELFDRLYVLRSQLIHGGATWQGSVNRDSVRDGTAIMAFLLPHFINLMLDNTDIDWGIPSYAVGTRILPSV